MAFTVVARCAFGHPLVIRDAPFDDEGHPFPTLFWLTCPEHIKAVSRLEAAGWIKRLSAEAETNPDLRTMLRRAHQAYAGERARTDPGTEFMGGVGGSASGLKCLHAHYAHFLAGGPDPIGAWASTQLHALPEPVHYERSDRRVAAIDLGTNSIRLLVARWTDTAADANADSEATGTFDAQAIHEGDETPSRAGAMTDLARDMVITRLGQGVDGTRRLSPAALKRTVAVLARYCRQARALDAERIHLTATSAVRDATNREELAAAVLKHTGEPMEVLSGEDEAAISFLGATWDLAGDPRANAAAARPPYLVVDIGGGSTEFVLGDEADPPQPAAAVSTQLGSVRLTERHIQADPPTYEEMAAVEATIDDWLASVEERVPVREARTLVAVAGTSTTVQAVALGLPEYDPERLHRTILRREDAERVAIMLADMTTEERRAIPSMAPGREDVIPAGAALLARVMRRWEFEHALVSETDILDGLALRLLRDQPPEHPPDL